MKKKILFLLCCMVIYLVFQACSSEGQTEHVNDEITTEIAPGPNNNNETQGNHKGDIQESVAYNEPESFKANDIIFAWVDKLIIRDQPNSKGTAITSIQSMDALEFTGEKSDNAETIVLRSVAYESPWLKVITPDKKEGWVFGGAVKRENETKGNLPISDDKFDLPYFGSFNLTQWEKLESKDESGGDAATTTNIYQKGNQILGITKTEVGEYGYSRTYKLMDTNKKLLKERAFDFAVDMDLRELTETVKDYTSNPPKQFQRKQKLKKHFMQLNAKPEMVNGVWMENTLEDAVTSEAGAIQK